MATTSVRGVGRAKYLERQRHNQDGGKAVEARKLRKEAVKAVDVIAAPMAPRASTGATLSKPGAFANDAEAAGWAVTRRVDPDDRSVKTVVCTREDETLEMTWHGNAMTTPGRHTAGDRSLSVLNAAAGRRILAVRPEDVVRVAPDRVAAPRRPQTISRRIPWTEEATDAELLEAVQGRKIEWTNGLSGEVEDDRIPRTGDAIPGSSGQRFYTNRHLSVEPSPDGLRRVLSWCGADGFRACYVESIFNVK